MTDDLEPLHRERRGVGALVALAAILGLVGGVVLDRAAFSDDPADFLATGGGGGSLANGDADDAGASGGAFSEVDYLGPPLELLGQRTTAQGIQLVVRAGSLGTDAVGCAPDRIVRVGVIADGALVGSALAETYPPDAAPEGLLRLTGIAEGRPVLLGILRTSGEPVSVRFPDGTVDTADAQDGVAVVAAFADPASTPEELLASRLEILDAADGTSPEIDGTRPPECIEDPPPSTPAGEGEKPPLPPAGEQPADPVTAEEQVRAAYLGAFDYDNSQDVKATFIERPEVWRDANQQLLDGPYGDAVDDLHAEVDEVVFTDPAHASVRYQLISSDERVPRYQIGDAVLVEGRWLVAITTPCDLLTLAGVHCNMSL